MSEKFDQPESAATLRTVPAVRHSAETSSPLRRSLRHVPTHIDRTAKGPERTADTSRPEPSGSRAAERHPHTFGFFLVPDFALLPFASATDALRVANWVSGERRYDWRFISEDGKPVSSSNGIPVAPHLAMEEATGLDDLIVVAGGHTAPSYHRPKVFAWIRQMARRNCRIGAVGLGTFVLARAGLLDGHRCTIHWSHLAGFKSEFPHLQITPEVFEIDRGLYTCSGGTGALDLMLTIIAEHHGSALATHVAEEFIHERVRSSHDDQRMSLRARLNTANPKLLQVVSLMESHLEEPLSCNHLAKSVGLSVRQLEKLFRAHLKLSPRDYYIRLRLHHARTLLRQTSMSVCEVGIATGFSSPSHFSKAYRAHFKKDPRNDRVLPGAGLGDPGRHDHEDDERPAGMRWPLAPAR